MKAEKTTYEAGDRVWVNDAYGNFHAATVTSIEENGNLHALCHGVFGEAIRLVVPAKFVGQSVNQRG